MKIITKKKQYEALRRISALQIICENYVEDIEAFTKMTEHLARMAFLIDGARGIDRVLSIRKNYKKENGDVE